MQGGVSTKPQSLNPETCCRPWDLFLSSIPMMLSILSGALMQLVDRSFLGYFSSEALTNATVAQQVYNVFMLPCLSFAAMSEIFVGQFNGAKLYKKTSTPILQIALFLILLEGLWAFGMIHPTTSHLILRGDLYEGTRTYVLIGLAIIPFQIFHAAFSAFFVGTRRANTVLPSVIAANIFNMILDPLFIFGSDRCGVGHWLAPQGAAGAAWATLFCTILSSVILGCCYFSRNNEETYGTQHFHFDRSILWKNIVLGAPYALSMLIEMGNWVDIANRLGKTSSFELQLNSLCLGLWNFLFFMIEGFQKGVVATASNLIGACREDKIPTIIRSAGKIALCTLLAASLPFVIFAKPVFNLLFHVPDIYIFPRAFEILLVQWVSFAVLSFTVGGLIAILCSGGDTLYVTGVRLSCCICCVIIPVQIISHYGSFTTLHSWALGLVNMVMAGILNYCRYRSGDWQHKVISHTE